MLYRASAIAVTALAVALAGCPDGTVDLSDTATSDTPARSDAADGANDAAAPSPDTADHPDTQSSDTTDPADAADASADPSDTAGTDTADTGGRDRLHPEALEVPEVAKPYDVGAIAGKPPEAFHDGAFFDITDYGAVPDDGNGDGPAIEQALGEARAADDGAVLIPEGTFLVGEASRIGINLTDKSNSTIVGAGWESHLKVKPGMTEKYAVIYYGGRSGPIENVKIANLRIDGNKDQQPEDGHGNGIKGYDYENADGPITIRNVWAHDAKNSNLSIDTQNTTIARITNWGTYRWHGVAADNEPPHNEAMRVEHLLSFDNGNDPSNNGMGIDASAGGIVLDTFLLTGNKHGMKTAIETLDTTIRNGLIVDNDQHGFYMSSEADRLEIDDVVSRQNGGEGFSIIAQGGENDYDTRVTIGEIYAVDNAQNGDLPGHMQKSIELAGPLTIESAGRIESCGAGNGAAGLRGMNVYAGTPSGTIDELVADGNDGGATTGALDGVTIGTLRREACDPPEVLPPNPAYP